MIENIEGKNHISRFLNNSNISSYFLYRIEEYNAIFGQQQIENIYQTIILIETKNKHMIRYIDDQNNSDIKNSLIITESTNLFLSKKNNDYYVKYKNTDNNGKLENLIKIHLQKCIKWCIEYDIPYYYF
jgi:hypothetical protein